MHSRRAISGVFLVLLFLAPGLMSAEGSSADLATLGFETPNFSLGASFLPGLANSFFVPDYLGYKLQPKEYEKFSEVMLWTKIGMGMFALNTAALIVTTVIDPLVGGIVSILSFGGWTLSTAFMAFNYRDINTMLTKRGEDSILPTVPAISSLIAYAFGMGTITAIGLSFSDYTGVAEALAYVCSAVSSISGIVAIVSTFTYSNKINYKEYKEQLSSLYHKNHF